MFSLAQAEAAWTCPKHSSFHHRCHFLLTSLSSYTARIILISKALFPARVFAWFFYSSPYPLLLDRKIFLVRAGSKLSLLVLPSIPATGQYLYWVSYATSQFLSQHMLKGPALGCQLSHHVCFEGRHRVKAPSGSCCQRWFSQLHCPSFGH